MQIDKCTVDSKFSLKIPSVALNVKQLLPTLIFPTKIILNFKSGSIFFPNISILFSFFEGLFILVSNSGPFIGVLKLYESIIDGKGALSILFNICLYKTII